MEKDTFEKLAVFYDKISDKYVLEKEQAVIYEIGKYLDIWCNPMLGYNFFYEKVSDESVRVFLDLGATVYAELVQEFIEEKNILENQRALYGKSRFEFREEKRILISKFARNMDNLLETDNIIEKYANRYIKEHKLHQHLKYFNEYEEVAKKRKKQFKQRILILALGGALLLPAAILACFDFGKSGNDLKLGQSLTNLAVCLGLCLIYISLIFFSQKIKKKTEKKTTKMFKVLNEFTTIMVMFVLGVFFSVMGSFAFLICALVIRLLMEDCKRYKFDFGTVAEEIGLKKVK